MKARRTILSCMVLLAALALLCLSAGMAKAEAGTEPDPAASAAPAEGTGEPAATAEPTPTPSPLDPVSAIDVMCEPCGILALEDGSLLVTDVYGKTVLQIIDGVSTVYAGGESVEDIYGEPLGGYVDGTPTESLFRLPWAVAPYNGGYAVSDADNKAIRLVTPDGVKTVNGKSSESLETGDMGVVFDRPTGLAADDNGNLFVCDTTQNVIRRIDSDGNVYTVTGVLTAPTGLYWKDGVLYVAETGSNRIVRISSEGRVMVIAGGGQEGMNDGPSALASFSSPMGVAVDDDGIVYVADTANSAIRRIQNGVVDTLLVRDASDLEENDPISPMGMAVANGKLYVCDSFARRILVIDLGK